VNEEELDQLSEWLATVKNDPYAFVLGAYDWGVGELAKYPDGPDEWQVDILCRLRDGLISIDAAIAEAMQSGEETDIRPIMEATTSGHGIGKSALVAWIIDWAMSTMVDTKGVVTANTENQLKTKTWAEMAKWHRLSVTAPLFKMTATARFSIDPLHEKTWRIDMVPWSEKNTEAFAGLHNHGKRILIIFDEASAIPDIIWEVTEGALTDKDTQILWLVFGNPTKNSGRFRECFDGGRFAHRWHHRAIDSRTVRISNKQQINDWIEDYGEDHDFVRVRVRGMFPRVDAVSFISLDDVRDAQARKPEGQEGLPIIGALDVARYGPDNSVFALRQGRDASSRPWQRISQVSTVVLARWAFEQYLRNNCAALVVDVGGVGGGVFDQLELMGINVFAVDFSSAPDNETTEKYFNKRAEMYGRLRAWIKKGGCLPVDDKNGEGKALSDQLCAPTFTFQADVKIQLESKKDIRRRLNISPDDADAIAITFAFPYLEEAFDTSQLGHNGGPPLEGETYTESDPYAHVTSSSFNYAGASR
jgi:hypothetical protein